MVNKYFFFLIKFYSFKINSKFFFNFNVFIFFFNLKKNITNIYIKPLYLSKKILVYNKNLFFFNIFNNNLDFSKQAIDFNKLYEKNFHYSEKEDCYLSIIKFNKYQKYTFNSKKLKKKKRRRNKFYRSVYLLFKNYGIYFLNSFFKKVKKISVYDRLKGLNNYYKKNKFFEVNSKYLKVKFFLNISSYKLFFNILLFYPFLFLNYSF